MVHRARPAKTGTNTADHLVIKNETSQGTYQRKDFFRDLKQASRKKDQPSQRDSEKR